MRILYPLRCAKNESERRMAKKILAEGLIPLDGEAKEAFLFQEFPDLEPYDRAIEHLRRRGAMDYLGRVLARKRESDFARDFLARSEDFLHVDRRSEQIVGTVSRPRLGERYKWDGRVDAATNAFRQMLWLQAGGTSA